MLDAIHCEHYLRAEYEQFICSSASTIIRCDCCHIARVARSGEAGSVRFRRRDLHRDDRFRCRIIWIAGDSVVVVVHRATGIGMDDIMDSFRSASPYTICR